MPTNAELKESVPFILYELCMLRVSAVPIFKDVEVDKRRQEIVKNLRLEGAVIHARNLRDLFFTKVNKHGQPVAKSDDIEAIAFFSDPSHWPWTSAMLPPYLATEKDRMNQAVAHISTNRLGWRGKGKEWQTRKFLDEIGPMWFEFVDALKRHNEPALSWFETHPRAKLVRFSPPF